MLGCDKIHRPRCAAPTEAVVADGISENAPLAVKKYPYCGRSPIFGNQFKKAGIYCEEHRWCDFVYGRSSENWVKFDPHNPADVRTAKCILESEGGPEQTKYHIEMTNGEKKWILRGHVSTNLLQEFESSQNETMEVEKPETKEFELVEDDEGWTPGQKVSWNKSKTRYKEEDDDDEDDHNMQFHQ